MDERERRGGKEGQKRGVDERMKRNDGYQSFGDLDQGLSDTHLAMFSIQPLLLPMDSVDGLCQDARHPLLQCDVSKCSAEHET